MQKKFKCIFLVRGKTVILGLLCLLTAISLLGCSARSNISQEHERVSQKNVIEYPQKTGPVQTADGSELGYEAPDFALKSLDGEKTVKLSDFKGKKPVVLVFGSYT